VPKKPKFKPEITRVKLNPEQAVLSCACYTGDRRGTGTWTSGVQWCAPLFGGGQKMLMSNDCAVTDDASSS